MSPERKGTIGKTTTLESGFATLADAQDVIARWDSCPWCLVHFDCTAAADRVSHVGRCAGNENAVRLARSYVRGMAATS